MTQSSCKRDTKSKSHPCVKLAPVRVFSCKQPLRNRMFYFLIACGQALLFGKAHRVARERFGVSSRVPLVRLSTWSSRYPPNGELAPRLIFWRGWLWASKKKSCTETVACEPQTYFRSSVLGGREATTGNTSAVSRLLKLPNEPLLNEIKKKKQNKTKQNNAHFGALLRTM